MSAEVETCMYVGDMPWHGLGVYVGDENVTSDVAIKAAGLDWTVSKRELLAEGVVPVPTHKAIVRDSDDSVLGVVGNRYRPLQNHEAFSFLDSLVKDGEIRYHTAGSLFDGKKVWMLAQVGGNIEPLPGDLVNKFLLLSTAHDGSASIRVFPTAVRVVCANTLALAVESCQGGISIRHVGNPAAKLEQAREVLGFANNQFDEFATLSNELANLKMSRQDWIDFCLAMFPTPEGAMTKRQATFLDNKRDGLTALFVQGRGQDIPGVRGTAWAALNAVTEFSNYEMGRTQEGRFDGLFSGTQRAFNQKAIGLLSKQVRIS